ncbi:hypothetical protein BVRB_6g153740 [Beta vulgaris subsp. vulgaris]|nr:hypothetical protein BVRB_6g153740 [Beta vulgaris subsp. vulgaris]
MASHVVPMFVLVLACSYLIISSNAIPASRLSNLPTIGRAVVVTKSMDEGQMISEAKMEDEFIEGRMDFEKNDYGPTTSNPVHTPRPPR